MANSIRSQLDKATTISEIRLILGQNRNSVCVVVEGADDQKLFVPLLNESNVVVFQSYSSKIGVDEIVNSHFLQNNRVIGIRDKDYDANPICNRVFFCDYCCAEMMIIANDTCFKRLYLNFYEQGQFDFQQLRLLCLKCLEKLSKYRMLNDRNHWTVIFDGIKPGNFYNTNQIDMDIAIRNELNNRNHSNPIDQARENDCGLLPRCQTLPEYLDITNGHDFIQLFCTLCKNNHGKNVSISEIEIALRSSFGKDAFMISNLYTQLKLYQEQNHLSVVA